MVADSEPADLRRASVEVRGWATKMKRGTGLGDDTWTAAETDLECARLGDEDDGTTGGTNGQRRRRMVEDDRICRSGRMHCWRRSGLRR